MSAEYRQALLAHPEAIELPAKDNAEDRTEALDFNCNQIL
jgi:hypothetical protein